MNSIYTPWSKQFLPKLQSFICNKPQNRPICTSCLHKSFRAVRLLQQQQRQASPFQRRPFSVSRSSRAKDGSKKYENPVDDPKFVSLVDQPVQLVRHKRRHGYGLIILALVPIISFGLGTWQVNRLEWKTTLIARYEDRLVRDPLPLPPYVNPNMIPEFDYRRILARGILRHDQEMLLGPRLHDGTDGYHVITPLERKDVKDAMTPEGKMESEKGTTLLVNRGWISKEFKDQAKRIEKGGREAMPTGEVVLEGLLRSPWKKNMFTPENKPEEGKFYFPDVQQMADHVGAQPVWVEQTLEPDLLVMLDREARGIPIGRAPEVNLRNNHLQYIFTWYALSAATTFMFYLVVRKPPRDLARRVRQSRDWA